MGWKKLEVNNSAWNFEENKEMVGTFTSIEQNVGPNASNLYHFKQEDETEINIWGNTLLDNRLKHLEAGQKVKIIYLGLATSPKTGREYKDFEIYVDEPDEGSTKEESLF